MAVPPALLEAEWLEADGLGGFASRPFPTFASAALAATRMPDGIARSTVCPRAISARMVVTPARRHPHGMA
jgi:hypothetical protein